MKEILEAQRGALQQLCEKHRVRRLELFGSAARGDSDPERSDLDFVAEFREMSPAEHADAFFGLQEALEHVFQRSVDIIELSAVKNPYFLRAIAGDRVVMYAAA